MKNAVETIFGVKVKNVKTLNTFGKMKRVRTTLGRQSTVKKAYVTLQEGYSIDKKSIVLEKPIEELGIFDVGVKLHSEVTAKIRLWVAKK